MEKLQQALQKARSERERYETENSADRVQTRNDADGAQPAPTDLDSLWAALPEAKLSQNQLIRSRVVSYDHTHDAAAFDILRTKVILQMRRNGWTRLAITSPTEACGKSTISGNLAMGMSRQSDLRAIMLELDLRRPSLSTILDLKPPHDISSVLSGEVPFAEQAMCVRGNVALSLANHASSDPTRYLLSNATADKLDEIQTAYQPDMMIFDTPPVMLSDDTRAFLGKVDCAMIIARAEKTTINQIDVCEREIAEYTNVLGVVLNQARFQEGNTGYGYGYGYNK